MRLLVVCAAIASLAVTAAAAAAPPPTVTPPGIDVDGDAMSSRAVVPDKRAFAQQFDSVAAARAGQTPAASRPDRAPQLSGYNSAWVYGAGSYVDIYFSDTVNTNRGWTSYCATFNNGYGDTAWMGSSPWNAQRLSYTQRWVFNGISIGVSIPGGADFSGSGNTVSWHHTYYGLWIQSHGYTGVQGCTGLLGIMYSVAEHHTGDWQVTSTAGQLVQANASQGVG